MADPIKSQAQFIVGQYDQNKDGQIKLPSPPKPCDGGDEGGCRIPTHETLRWKPKGEVASHYRLFKDADADGNGFATTDEVDQVIRTFDKDGDGKLDAEERKAFNQTYKEEIE